MNIVNALKQLRDDIKTWVTNNLNALNAKIDEKTIPIDSELSSTSTNPVQNQAISKEIDSINDRVGDTPVATQISQAINAQEHFSGDYNDLTNAPDISEDGSGNMIIADEAGNIIFKADADGMHTTAVSINGEAAATEKYVNEAIANIDIPDVDFTGYATETYVDNKVADLVNSAPEALDTLGELATALENHEDAYDALLETVGSKATHTDLENLKTEISESIVSETDEFHIVDDAGNIVASIDANGVATTTVTAQSIIVNGGNVEEHLNNAEIHVTTAEKEAWNKKVDRVEGKGLSTNDFTNAYKEKLDELENITFEESDPTVPAWAKEPTKPTYTADEVGALPEDTLLFSGDYNDLTNAPEVFWEKAEGESGIRLKGTNGTATGNQAISAGDDKTASDGTAFKSIASGDHAVAFGYGNTCSGRSTLAQGLYNLVESNDSVAFGQRNILRGTQSFAAGQQNEITARLGVTLGYENKVTNTSGIAMGYKNTASGSGAIAVGDTCVSSGTSTFAVGYHTQASGDYSSTFG